MADPFHQGKRLPPDTVPHLFDRQAVRDDQAAHLQQLNRPGRRHRLAGSNTGTWLQPPGNGEPGLADPTADGPAHDSHLRVLRLPARSIDVQLLGPPLRRHPKRGSL